MADFDSSLPIRTEGAGDVVVKVADATIPSQQLAVEADGSINVNATISATDLDIRDLDAAQDNIAISDGTDTLAVNADGSLNITDNGGSLTVDAVNLDIRDLAFATDKVDASGSTLGANSGVDIGDVTINNAAGASAVNIQDGGNSITVDGSVTVSATDLDIRDLSSAQDSVAVLQATHDNLNLNANLQVGDADVANGNPVPVSDAGGSLTVDATDLDIRDLTHVSDSVKVGDGTDLLAVNSDGSLNVVIVSEQDGTEVIDYQTSTAVAANASVNHDYTVPGGVTFYGEEAWMSASGKIKAQLLINGSVKWVGFNSSANPNIRIPLEHLAKAAATQVVRITLTNLDNQAQDLYSTLLGVTKA